MCNTWFWCTYPWLESAEDEEKEADIDKKIKELNNLDDINEIEEEIQDIKEDLNDNEKNDIE